MKSGLLPVLLLGLLPALCGAGCSSDPEPAWPPAGPGRPVTAIQVKGPDDPEAGLAIALDRCVELLQGVPGLRVRRLAPDEALGTGIPVLALGRSGPARTLIPDGELAGLEPGGTVLRLGTVDGATVLAGAGPDGLGDQYAGYALLERLGFGFFHPEDISPRPTGGRTSAISWSSCWSRSAGGPCSTTRKALTG